MADTEIIETVRFDGMVKMVDEKLKSLPKVPNIQSIQQFIIKRIVGEALPSNIQVSHLLLHYDVSMINKMYDSTIKEILSN